LILLAVIASTAGTYQVFIVIGSAFSDGHNMVDCVSFQATPKAHATITVEYALPDLFPMCRIGITLRSYRHCIAIAYPTAIPSITPTNRMM
jgi:hypothetical protein